MVLGFEILNLKLCKFRLWELTVAGAPPARAAPRRDATRRAMHDVRCMRHTTQDMWRVTGSGQRTPHDTVISHNFNLQIFKSRIESQNPCLFSLQNALWKFKSPRGWTHFSLLSFWKPAVRDVWQAAAGGCGMIRRSLWVPSLRKEVPLRDFILRKEGPLRDFIASLRASRLQKDTALAGASAIWWLHLIPAETYCIFLRWLRV